MNKQDLLKLKEMINNLNEEEKLLRDEYLKKISTGEIYGPQTGYSSIDKPWLRYYRENPVREINPNQTIYQMVFEQNNINDEAIGYLGTTWTFGKLKKEVDKCADAFAKLGVRLSDTVLVGVSNSPEAVVILLALNKIGAVSKWFDLRASEKDIKEYAESSNCKYMVAFDMLLPKVEKIIDETNINKVLVLSPLNSLSNIVKLAVNFKNKMQKNDIQLPNDERFVEFDKFIKHGNANSNLECAPFDKDRPSIMIQSSGTTGKPKTIVHSDFSATQSTRAIAYSDLPLGKNKKVLVALPPWIAYGIGDAIILPLTLGSKVELSPNFEPDAVYKNVGKFTIAFAAPFHYRYLRENFSNLNTKQKELFGKVECLISGGDKITIEENKDWEDVFKTVVVNGYGNNEGWGALSVNPTKYNKYGTVGIPKYEEIIISYDPETKMELTYGEVGEICSLSKTEFLEYEKNKEATLSAKMIHEDKGTWLHTGDLGFVDNEGYIHLGGRARRVITRLGFKISAYTIEDNIAENPFVKECVAISVEDELEEHVPMVYAILKDEYQDKMEEAEKLIFDRCKKTLKEYEIPKYIKIVKELPYTQNAKYDFMQLEKQGNEYVKLLLEQDSKIKTLKKK